MFKTSIDNKSKVTDPNGNEIVDLTSSTFRTNQRISQYFLRKVPSEYVMRPDLISLAELGTTEKTEYIMMFNQIGNPFSIDKDDVLMIPELIEADSMVLNAGVSSQNPDESDIRDILVKNYYKHSNRNNTVDMSSYDEFLNSEIPSGNPTGTNGTTQTEGIQPYLLRGNEEAVVIRNGRIYFNDPNDVGLNGGDTGGAGTGGSGSGTGGSGGQGGSGGTTGGDSISVEEIDDTNVDEKIESIINGVETDLSESNCTYNGTNLSDFIKALNMS